MDKLNKVVVIGGVIMICLLSVIAWNVSSNKVVDNVVGSVAQDSSYHYTQFSGAIATTTLIQTGVTTLGSVIITEDFVGALLFLDATSTTAYSIANATQIVDMPSALTEGTYTFDVYALKGLVMQSADGSAFAGDITVTWR